MHRLRIVSLFLLLVACNNTTGGLGFGRPAFTPPTQAALTPVAITQVYAPTGNAGAAFVQLENQSGDVIDFGTTKLTLISDTGAIDIGSAAVVGGDSNQQWASGARRAVAAGVALQLHPSSGELAVVSQTGIVQGSASWGTPSQSGAESSNYPAQSAADGSPDGVAGASLPFPVPSNVAVNLDPNVNSPCVAPDAATMQASVVSCPQSTGIIALTRVLPGSLDPNLGTGYIEVRNLSADALDLYGLQICTPTCKPLRYGNANPNNYAGVLAATGTVAAGDVDPSRAVILTGGSGTNLSGNLSSDIVSAPPQGEVFLLRAAAPATGFVDSDMLAYVAYAQSAQSTNVVQSIATATQAGVWQSTALIKPANIDAEALALTDATGVNRTSWVPSTDAAQTTPTGVWSSCSYPAAPAAPSLAITQVANTTPPRVQLTNISSTNVDLSNVALSLGDNGALIALNSAKSLNANITAFAPNAQLWVEVQPAGGTCTALQNVCAAVAVNGLTNQEASVLDTANQNAVVAHVQWGAATTSVNGAAAASAGAWPLQTCRAAAPPQGLSLSLVNAQPGQGAGDYGLAFPTFP